MITQAGDADLEPLIQEIIELNNIATRSVTDLGKLHDSYGLIIAAHRDLGKALVEPDFVPVSIQKLSTIAK